MDTLGWIGSAIGATFGMLLVAIWKIHRLEDRVDELEARLDERR